MKKPFFCDKPEDKNHIRTPEKSSPMKPMPALGCMGKYFRDTITRERAGDPVYHGKCQSFS